MEEVSKGSSKSKRRQLKKKIIVKSQISALLDVGKGIAATTTNTRAKAKLAHLVAETASKEKDAKFHKFMKPPEPTPTQDPLGISILSPAKNVWLEHTIHHVGSLPPSPYEYDISYSDENRCLIVIPVFETVSFVAEPQRRSGIGYLRTNLISPPEFSCRNAYAEEICNFTYTTKFQHQKSCIQPRTTEFRMNVLIRNRHMGRVVQQKKTIMVYDSNDNEIIEVVQVPRTTGWCYTPAPKEFSCPVFLRDADVEQPSLIGFMGRNGPDKAHSRFGSPLGFYFSTGEGKDFPIPAELKARERYNLPLDNLHKVFLLAAIVGMMTKHTSLKC